MGASAEDRIVTDEGNFCQRRPLAAFLAKGGKFAKEGNFGTKGDYAEDGVFAKEGSFCQGL